jgi:hypothetical protein
VLLDRVPESSAAYPKARAHDGARISADVTWATGENCGACRLIQPVEAKKGAEPLAPWKARAHREVNASRETVLDEVRGAIDAGGFVVVLEKIRVAIRDTQ